MKLAIAFREELTIGFNFSEFFADIGNREDVFLFDNIKIMNNNSFNFTFDFYRYYRYFTGNAPVVDVSLLSRN